MCGIYAIIPNTSVYKSEVIGMSKFLSHRGPDEDAVLIVKKNNGSFLDNEVNYTFHYGDSINEIEERIDSNLILGHRRLSIIDLSPLGRQPMTFLDRYWIIFNGEIYNYIELADELRELGCTLKTSTDTEVILAAYHYWGEACLERFNGMWAFILYDSKANNVFIARDRFGVKPLYYRISNRGLSFSSEIKAFTALKDWSFDVNENRLIDYLVWNVIDHTHETLFKGVFQIPAGSFVKLDLDMFGNNRKNENREGDILETFKWYKLERRVKQNNSFKKEHDLQNLIISSVKLRLRSDVQVGACLSGGIDSSTIASIIGSQLSVENALKFKTVTAGSNYSKFDERVFADVVNRKYCLNSNEVVVNDVDLFEVLEKMIWHQDEPFGSTSTFAQWKVFEKAREAKIKVMLDGQGADEIFCGYPGFFGPFLASLLKKGSLKAYVRNFISLHKKNQISVFKILGYTLGYLFPSLLRSISRFDGKSYGNLGWLKNEFRASAKHDPFALYNTRRSVKEMSYAQIQYTNLPMLLHWEDRNSMAFSIEARVPFLDFRIVEFAMGLNDEDKINNGITKKVLREAAKGLVPDEILSRRDKMGFVTAEPEWMKGNMMMKFRNELLLAKENFKNILDDRLIVMFDEFCSGNRKYDNFFWRIICANHWYQLFNEKKYQKWQ